MIFSFNPTGVVNEATFMINLDYTLDGPVNTKMKTLVVIPVTSNNLNSGLS